jgi:hypothetical protein
MGRTSRLLAIAAALGLIALGVVLAPQIADIKEDNAERDRREAAEARERRIKELKELMTPRTAAAPTPASPIADIERLISADARGRPDVKRVLRTECERIRGGGGRYSCTAITSEAVGGGSVGAVGIPYRAIVRGRALVWCRIAGHPGEGSVKGKPLVPIPLRCGG